jgi:hypothetical protein
MKHLRCQVLAEDHRRDIYPRRNTRLRNARDETETVQAERIHTESEQPRDLECAQREVSSEVKNSATSSQETEQEGNEMHDDSRSGNRFHRVDTEMNCSLPDAHAGTPSQPGIISASFLAMARNSSLEEIRSRLRTDFRRGFAKSVFWSYLLLFVFVLFHAFLGMEVAFPLLALIKMGEYW